MQFMDVSDSLSLCQLELRKQQYTDYTTFVHRHSIHCETEGSFLQRTATFALNCPIQDSLAADSMEFHRGTYFQQNL